MQITYDIGKIKELNPLVDVVKTYNIQLKKSGRELVGFCPFHNDKKIPNFYITPHKELWNCFVCDAGGDVVTFVAKIENLSTGEAIKKLAERAGIEPIGQREENQNYLKKRGFAEEIVEKYGLVEEKTRIKIPYFNPQGEVEFYKIRKRYPKDKNDRFYYDPSGIEVELYNNWSLANYSDYVIITAGEIDSLSLLQLKFQAVGCPGEGLFKEGWLPLFDHVQTVYICFDGDQAGRDKALKTAKLFGSKAYILELPEGKDINDLLVEGKDDSYFLQLTDNCKTAEEFESCLFPGEIRELFDVKKKIEKWLFLEDYQIIDIILGVVIANEFPGDPVWLFLIAPPGGTKTEILRALSGDKFYTTTTLTPHSLISGLNTKKQVDLIPLLDQKILIVKDLTPTLTMGNDDRNQLFSDLRDAYDGYIEKVYGSGVGKKSFESRFGLIAGVTPAIDMYSSVHSLLGERFLKVRVQTNPHESVWQANRNVGKEEAMRKELREAFAGFLKGIDKDNFGKISIPEKIEEKLVLLSIFVATIRSQVIRDRQHLVLAVPEAEIGTRILKQLKKLLWGLAIIRNKEEIEEEEYKVLKRIGKDSIPLNRFKTVEALLKLDDYQSTREIGEEAKIPTGSIHEVLEDLWMLKLINKDTASNFDKWKIKEEIAQLIKKTELIEVDDV